MNKTVSFEVFTSRHKGEWIDVPRAIANRTQDSTSLGWTLIGGSPCFGCTTIVETSNYDALIQKILDSFKGEVATVDPATGTITQTNSTLNQYAIHANLSGNGSTYYLPTDADYVVDIYFDAIHTKPTIDWDFTPWRTITTTPSLDSNVVVSAYYVSRPM